MQSLLGSSGSDTAAVLETLLEIADSLMMYGLRYLMNLRLVAVADLLLTDETNPRSLAYQLVCLADHVDHLPRDSSMAPMNDCWSASGPRTLEPTSSGRPF